MSFFSNLRFRSSKRKNATKSTSPYKNGNSRNSSQASLATGGSHQQAQQMPGATQPISISSIRNQESPLFLQQPFSRAALVRGSFQTIVELPRYVDINEWLALNIFEFNTYLTQVISMLSEVISDSVPMNAGQGRDYLWMDVSKQPIRLGASTYIDYTLSWISSKFDDPMLFPTRPGVPFSPNFANIVVSIYTQQFRLFAYLYHNHFEEFVHLSLEPHFNSLFCHFTSFGKTFGLIDRNEALPLQHLIQNFEAQGKIA